MRLRCPRESSIYIPPLASLSWASQCGIPSPEPYRAQHGPPWNHPLPSLFEVARTTVGFSQHGEAWRCSQAIAARLYHRTIIPLQMDGDNDLQWSSHPLLACSKDTTDDFLNPYSETDYQRWLKVHPRYLKTLSALMSSQSSSRPGLLICLFDPSTLESRL